MTINTINKSVYYSKNVYSIAGYPDSTMLFNTKK